MALGDIRGKQRNPLKYSSDHEGATLLNRTQPSVHFTVGDNGVQTKNKAKQSNGTFRGFKSDSILLSLGVKDHRTLYST